MDFALLIYIDESRFDGMSEAENERFQQACRDADSEIERAGKLIAARALRTPDMAQTVTIRASKLVRTDGPFAETKEYLGGLILLRASGMEEALDIAQNLPIAHYTRVEVRPAYDIRA
jgi:hypothetical protein